MLYLMHCSFAQHGQMAGHGHFDFVVDAPDVASAKGRLREKLDDIRSRDDLLDDPVDVFLDDVIEIDEVPAEGLIGRYQLFLGERPTTIFRSTPCNAVPASDLAEPADDEDEPDGGVLVEPFAAYRAKGE